MLEVGRIVKAHGLKGEVVVDLLTDHAAERLAPGAVLHAGGRPLVVVTSKPFQHRFIVQFEGLASREHADELHGVALLADPIEDPDALFVHDLIGSTVVDTSGTVLGTVAEVEANPASDLLVLDAGGLVPLTFFVSKEGDRIVVDPPAGLLD